MNALQAKAQVETMPLKTTGFTFQEAYEVNHAEKFVETLFKIQRSLPEDKSPVMIELGSNWAYYSLIFRVLFDSLDKNPKNVLIEPVKELFDLGVANFAMKDFDATFIRAFVGQEPENSRGFYRTLSKRWRDTFEECPVVSLDSVMEEEKIDELHLLHCDVDGAEMDVLKGAEKSFKNKKILNLVMSTHNYSCKTHNPCVEKLKSFGCEIVFEDVGYQELDGLIIASLQNENSVY